ncbi:hypothetical protein Tco_1372450, partial [Tanacetum coccineum]
QKITTAKQKLQLLSKYLSLKALFEGRLLIYAVKVWMEGYVISKVGDEVVHKELGDIIERAATTASSLEAEQDSSGPRCHNTILGDVGAQTRFETTSGYTLGSREDSDYWCIKVNAAQLQLNAAKLMLMLLGSVNAVRHMLMLPVQVLAAEESDGFVEIIDFLKASSVHYALTVNPIIYTSCIQQFWATTQVKMVNGVR